MWPDYNLLANLGLRDHFFHLLENAGLLGFINNEVESYVNLTKEFVFTFKHHFEDLEPYVAFYLYNKNYQLSLAEFCTAIHVACEGLITKVNDKDAELT